MTVNEVIRRYTWFFYFQNFSDPQRLLADYVPIVGISNAKPVNGSSFVAIEFGTEC